jgi:hypothetical protein
VSEDLIRHTAAEHAIEIVLFWQGGVYKVAVRGRNGNGELVDADYTGQPGEMRSDAIEHGLERFIAKIYPEVAS